MVTEKNILPSRYRRISIWEDISFTEVAKEINFFL